MRFGESAMLGSFLAGAKATVRRVGASDLSYPPPSTLIPTTTRTTVVENAPPNVAEGCEERTSRVAGAPSDEQQLRSGERRGNSGGDASSVSASSSFSRFRASGAASMTRVSQ